MNEDYNEFINNLRKDVDELKEQFEAFAESVSERLDDLEDQVAMLEEYEDEG